MSELKIRNLHRAFTHFLSSFWSKPTYFSEKGCSKSYCAEDLVPVSVLRHMETKSRNSIEKLSGRRGDGFSFKYAKRSQKPVSGVGHLPVAHSIIMMPKLHKSVSFRYWEPDRRSGYDKICKN